MPRSPVPEQYAATISGDQMALPVSPVRLRHRGFDWAADLLPSSTAAAFPRSTSGDFTMKTKPCLLSVSLAAAVLSVSLLAVQPASALTVFDPSNFVQNTLIAVRTLEQINNQINQLQNEAQMLMKGTQPGESDSTSSTGCARRWRPPSA